MTFAFVAKHRHIWPVSWMCEVLGVSRSGFHAWLRRPISARATYDAKLVVAIDQSFRASDRTYGARRVWRDVLEDGLARGLYRIERLMRQNAMRARPKRRGTHPKLGYLSPHGIRGPRHATLTRCPRNRRQANHHRRHRNPRPFSDTLSDRFDQSLKAGLNTGDDFLA